MTEITLLDGGMGQELIQRSPEPPTGQFGTQVMIDYPGMVAEVHRDYFNAGASIGTTNSYAIHHDRFLGTSQEGRQSALIDLALSEAEAARSATGSGRIAGSIGPLIWSYKPDAHPDYETAKPLYAEVANLLAPRVDLILCETVASIEHARAALDGARTTDRPVWLSVTIDDEDGSLLRSGEPVADLADLSPDAWLSNCSAPEAMGAALDVFATWDRPFGAYANGFEEITKAFLEPLSAVDKLSARRDLGPEAYARFALEWIDQGATIVGGCCEIGPAHIQEIARQLKSAGHDIV
ncbi:MAG: homocysteine S-methyltransferase family protein [Boseongicola sp.]